MKAIICSRYGPPEVLQLRDVEKPVPGNNEVLVRIRATTVTAGDCETRRFKIQFLLWLPMRLWLGLRKPRVKILGTELAGEIESTGKDVQLFKKGDRVFGSAGLSFGTYAQYKCLPEKGALAIKPANMTYEEAAAVPFGGRDALYYLRKGNVRSGQKVLIIGAGGSIGNFAVQLAKLWGAEVTGVDSAPKLDMIRSIGADRVVDYTREDFNAKGDTYDVIFDTVGKISLLRSAKSLQKQGVYLLANPGLWQMIAGLWTSLAGRKKVIAGSSRQTTEDLVYLKGLAEDGKIKSVVDRSYSLEQMAEAHRYVETGQKKGHVVITVD